MFKNIKKIRTKILLPTLVVIFLALSITGILSAYLSYNSTLRTLNQTMMETVEAASNRVTAELKNYKTLLSELAGIVETVDSQQVLPLLENSRARHGFENISITLPTGVVEGTGEDVSQNDFFRIPRDKGIPYVSEPVLNADGQSMTIYVSAPVMADGTFDGVIFIGLDGKSLSDIVTGISVGKTGTTAIIDKNGTTIAYYDYPTVLMKYNTNDEEKSDSKLSRLAALEREVMAGNSGFGAYSYGGVDKFMTYAPVIDTNGWGMYVTVEQSEFMQGTYTSIFISTAVSVIFLILASVILIILARSISVPIINVEQVAAKMAEGNYDVEITYQSNDEIGGLAESMRQMLAITKAIIVDTTRGLDEISRGNFDVAPTVEYIGIFHGIENSMKRIIIDLSETMSQIRISAEQVSSGSEQVSSGAQALAQGATEQASSVEELSASINEVSNQIKENAVNAGEAKDTVDGVGVNISISNIRMTEMISAMSEISDFSSKIGKIIKTIEDIAFQTNILALNAAVEAARAGTAGKGFAVVADEVRNLANKSSEAAKQTNTLIEGSAKSVDHGVMIAKATAEALSEVVSGAQTVTDLISKISQASEEQSQSISQINLGVEQISSVVQTNSATSEESAAASEELNSQASMMRDLVGKFKVKSNKF